MFVWCLKFVLWLTGALWCVFFFLRRNVAVAVVVVRGAVVVVVVVIDVSVFLFLFLRPLFVLTGMPEGSMKRTRTLQY